MERGLLCACVHVHVYADIKHYILTYDLNAYKIFSIKKLPPTLQPLKLFSEVHTKLKPVDIFQY